MRRPGLDLDGFIEREGALERVPRTFQPVVDTAKSAIVSAFGPERLHSAYLYGSIPRGTAVPGVSDLDVLLVLHDEPTAVIGTALAFLPIAGSVYIVTGLVRRSAAMSLRWTYGRPVRRLLATVAGLACLSALAAFWIMAGQFRGW